MVSQNQQAKPKQKNFRTWSEILADPVLNRWSNQEQETMLQGWVAKIVKTEKLSTEETVGLHQAAHAMLEDYQSKRKVFIPMVEDQAVNEEINAYLRESSLIKGAYRQYYKFANKATLGWREWSAKKGIRFPPWRDIESERVAYAALNHIRQFEGLSAQKIAEMPVTVAVTALQFAALAKIGVVAGAKKLIAARGMLGWAGRSVHTGILLAAHELARFPTSDESDLSFGEYAKQRAKMAGQAGVTGLAIGASQIIPWASIRAPLVGSGLMYNTWRQTGGDLEATIETGLHVIAFEAMGAFEKAASVRGRRADLIDGLKIARKRNVGLRNLSDKEITNLARTTIQFRNLADSPDKVAIKLVEKIKGLPQGNALKTLEKAFPSNKFFQNVLARVHYLQESKLVPDKVSAGIAKMLDVKRLKLLKSELGTLESNKNRFRNMNPTNLVRYFMNNYRDQALSFFEKNVPQFSKIVKGEAKPPTKITTPRTILAKGVKPVGKKIPVLESKVGTKWRVVGVPKEQRGDVKKGTFRTVKESKGEFAGLELTTALSVKGKPVITQIRFPKAWTSEKVENWVEAKLPGSSVSLKNTYEGFSSAMKREMHTDDLVYKVGVRTAERISETPIANSSSVAFQDMYATMPLSTTKSIGRSANTKKLLKGLGNLNKKYISEIVSGNRASLRDVFKGLFPHHTTLGVSSENHFFYWLSPHATAGYVLRHAKTIGHKQLSPNAIKKRVATLSANTFVHELSHIELKRSDDVVFRKQLATKLRNMRKSGKFEQIKTDVRKILDSLDFTTFLTETQNVNTSSILSTRKTFFNRILAAFGGTGTEGRSKQPSKDVSRRGEVGRIKSRPDLARRKEFYKETDESAIAAYLKKEYVKAGGTKGSVKEIEKLILKGKHVGPPAGFAGAVKEFAFTWSRDSERKLRNVERFGKSGGELADRLRFYDTEKGIQTDRTNVIIRTLHSKTSASQEIEIGKVLEGRQSPSSPRVARIATAHKRLYDFFFSLAKKADAMTRLPDGTYVPLRKVEKYFPRMLKNETYKAIMSGKGDYYNQAVNFNVEKMLRKKGAIRKGMSRTEISSKVKNAQAERLVAAEMVQYDITQSRMKDFGNISRPRVADYPENFYESSATKVLLRYSHGFWDWYFKLPLQGYPKSARKVKPNERLLIKSLHKIGVERGADAVLNAKKIANDAMGMSQTQMNQQLEAVLRPIREINTITMIGMNPPLILKQLTQVHTSVEEYGYIATAKAVGDLMTKSHYRKQLVKSGVFGVDPAVRLSLGESQSMLRKAVSISLTGFKQTDNVGRAIGGMVAVTRAKALIEAAKQGKSFFGYSWASLGKTKEQIQKMALDDLKYLGITKPKELVKRGKLTPHDMRILMKRGGDDPYFQTAPLNMPQGFSASPILKTLFQFGSFGWKQAEFKARKFIHRELYQKRNPLPLMRMLVGGVLTGELAIVIEHLFTGEDRLETSLPRRLIEDLLFIGTFGMIERIYYANPTSWFTGPTGSLIVDSISKSKQVVTGELTAEEALKSFAKKRISGLRFAEKVIKSKLRSSYENFAGKVRGAAAQGKSGGLTGLLGSKVVAGSHSKLWEAAATGSYRDFKAQMNRSVRKGIDPRNSVKSLIRRRNPLAMYRSLSPEEKSFLRKHYKVLDQEISFVRKFWRSNSDQLKIYLRRYMNEDYRSKR